MRRDDLLDSLGLDRLQPLERRARDDVGARCDGDHIRGAPLSSCSPDRRSTRREPPNLEPDRRRPGVRARRRRGVRRAGDGRHARGRPRPREEPAGPPAGGQLLHPVPRGVPLSRPVLRSLRIENFVLIREADLAFGPGLNAVTGETGAGKTILAQALGLLLGARGDAGYVGPGAPEAYVEAELDLSEGILDDEELTTLRELRPEGEEGLIAARRVFADGRTRAYAWGRTVPREELALVVDRLLAMSGQFEQRRLSKPSFQLDLLDAFVGDDQLRRRAELSRAWRALIAARQARDELVLAEEGRAARLEELRQLVQRTEGFDTGSEERLQAERLRLRRSVDLAAAASTAAEALAPDQGEGAAEQAARAGQALAGVAGFAPELTEIAAEVAEAEV